MNEVPCRNHVNQAFTLIELLAVMLLIGLIAGSITLSLTDHLAGARLTRAADTLESLDRKARSVAQRDQIPVSLEIDLSNAKVRCSHRAFRKITTLAKDVRITSVGIDGRTVSSGMVTLKFATSGQSATYTITLASGEKNKSFLIALGRSGQITHTRNETEASRIANGGPR